MMNSEERLDALLTALQRDDATGHMSSTGEQASDDELAALVATAQRLASLRVPLSDPAVAQVIKARVLEQATERRQRGEVAQRRERDRRHAIPTMGWGVLRPALVAAAVVLAVGMVGTGVAATQASPGSPLFALHRVEQSIQANVAPDTATRARQHLQFAREWLATLHTAATQPLGDAAYADALRALRDEDAAAAHEIAQVRSSTQRTMLESELATLRTDERTMLRATLSTASWPNRIDATTALGALGVTVPHVTSATLVEDTDDHWLVTLTGTGFQPGALLLVNGQPTGSVIASSNGVLTASFPVDALMQAPSTVGVGNPDGTAAATSNARMQKSNAATATPDRREQGTPTSDPEETPTALPPATISPTPVPTDTTGG